MNSEAENVTTRILLSIPESTDLSDFVTSLEAIRIRDVMQFNQAEEILSALHQTKKYNYLLFKSEESDTQKRKSLEEKLIDSVSDQKLLLDITFTIGLRLIARNQIGVLAKILNEIAEQGFFISSVKQEFSPNQGEDLIELLLTLQGRPESKIAQEVKKVRTITRVLQKIPAIRVVQRLGIEYL